MKKYRDCLADAYVLHEALEYLATQADFYEGEAERYVKLLEEADDEDSYLAEQRDGNQAKAAAFERLIAKLTK